MRKWLVCALAVVGACAVLGCSEGGSGKTDNEKKFQDLYKQYSARLNEKMTQPQAESIPPLEVTAESARLWDEVFGPHKALVAKRAEEILKELDTCPAIQEDLYDEIASATRQPSAAVAKSEPPAPPAKDEQKPPLAKEWRIVVASPSGKATSDTQLPDEAPGAGVLKQFRWNPLGDAQMIVNNTLAQIMKPESFASLQVVRINASPIWETIDRSMEHPKLCLRQGPMIYIVEMSRKDDYYQAEKFRWLKPKPAAGSTPAPAAAGSPAAAPPAAPLAPAPAAVPGAAPPVTPIPGAAPAPAGKPKG